MSSSWLAEREFTWMFCGASAGARRKGEELIVTSRTSSYPGCSFPLAEGPRTGSVYATSQLTESALEVSISQGSLSPGGPRSSRASGCGYVLSHTDLVRH